MQCHSEIHKCVTCLKELALKFWTGCSEKCQNKMNIILSRLSFFINKPVHI